MKTNAALPRAPRGERACLSRSNESVGVLRVAFTLVELLAVIAIVGLLVALLLPAVQASRESARRLQCGNHLKQIGLAAQLYERSQGSLPPSRIAEHSASWAVLILPYLEQQTLFGQWDIRLLYYNPANAAARITPVVTYFCPSRSTPQISVSGDNPDTGGAHLPGARSDYSACSGDFTWSPRGWADGYASDIQTGQSFPFRANGAIVASTYPYAWPPPSQTLSGNWSGRVTAAHVRDGLSNTIGFGEQHLVADGSGLGYGSVYNGDKECNFVANAGPGNPLAFSDMDEPVGQRTQWWFGSAHPGVCLFVMLDGRVAPLEVTIDTTTLGNLAARNDGQVTAFPGP